METYIAISWLNDFIFCPRSIYFHQLFGAVSTRLYHREWQIEGKAVHESIDQKSYSTRKTVYQGIEVFSEKYGICGNIDLYDEGKRELTERKKKITTIYDGYVFQLYAQYFGLLDAGFMVERLFLYSYDTNKRFPILLPHQDKMMFEKFESLVKNMNECDLSLYHQTNEAKCRHCVYSALCDEALC